MRRRMLEEFPPRGAPSSSRRIEVNKLMRVLKENLLIQFSIASSVVIITLAMVLAYVFTVQLNNDIDLLKQHSAAMMSGTVINDAEPFSIPSLTRNMANLQWITYSSLAGGFAFLYGALFLIVWRGWKIIRTQRSNLQSLNAQLNERVTQSVEQLQKANEELRVEVQEHRRAEHALRDSNHSLEEAYAELRETQQQITHQERMRAMGQMASGVAHDFNNALGPIVAYTDLLLEVPEAQDDKEEMTGYLQAMRTSAKDATNMVKRLQGFYRPPDSSEMPDAPR